MMKPFVPFMPGPKYQENKNILGLKFFEGDWIENYVLNEIELDYRPDELGLTKDCIVIDIGAHVGTTSLYIAKKYGCRVWCFEPSPHNYRRLVENIKINNLEDLIIPYHMAVTKDGRDVKIGNDPTNWAANRIYVNDGDPAKSIAFEDIIKEHPSIDLLKIDCEGAEFEIFENLKLLIGVKAIRGEFHSLHYDDIGFLLARVKTIVPNARVTMQRNKKVRKEMRKAKDLIAKKLARK